MASTCQKNYCEEETDELENNQIIYDRKYYPEIKNNSDQLWKILQPDLFPCPFAELDLWMRTKGQLAYTQFHIPRLKPGSTFQIQKKYITGNKLRAKDRNSNNVTMALKYPDYYSEEEKSKLGNNKTKCGLKYYPNGKNISDQLRQILQPELFSNDFEEIDGSKFTYYQLQIPKPFSELYETLQRKTAKENLISGTEVHCKGKRPSPVDTYKVVYTKKSPTSHIGRKSSSNKYARARWNRTLSSDEPLEMVRFSINNS